MDVGAGSPAGGAARPMAWAGQEKE